MNTHLIEDLQNISVGKSLVITKNYLAEDEISESIKSINASGHRKYSVQRNRSKLTVTIKRTN